MPVDSQIGASSHQILNGIPATAIAHAAAQQQPARPSVQRHDRDRRVGARDQEVDRDVVQRAERAEAMSREGQRVVDRARRVQQDEGAAVDRERDRLGGAVGQVEQSHRPDRRQHQAREVRPGVDRLTDAHERNVNSMPGPSRASRCRAAGLVARSDRSRVDAAAGPRRCRGGALTHARELDRVRIALFSEVYWPMVSGVGVTLLRLTDALHARGPPGAGL